MPTQYSVQHFLSSPKGGFPSIRLNHVCIEPHLQRITGEHLSGDTANLQEGIHPPGCRCKRAMRGRYKRIYFYVRIFNPHTISNMQTNPSACCRKHDGVMKRAYEQRIQEIEINCWYTLCAATTLYSHLLWLG